MQDFQVVGCQLVSDGDAGDGSDGDTVMDRADERSFRRLMDSQNVRWSRNLKEANDIIAGRGNLQALLWIRCSSSIRLKKENSLLSGTVVSST